jgi:hypothetical protein
MNKNASTSKAPDKYSARRTNIYLSPEEKALAKQVLKATGYNSLSGFVRAQLRIFNKKNQARIRKDFPEHRDLLNSLLSA